MPHIVINMIPGRSAEQKLGLAKKVHEVVAQELELPLKNISVSVNEIPLQSFGELIMSVPPEDMLVPPNGGKGYGKKR